MECCNASVMAVTINVLNCSIVVLEKKKHDTKETRKKFRQQGMRRIKMGGRGGINEAIFEVLTAVLLKTEVCCDVTPCRLVNKDMFRG